MNLSGPCRLFINTCIDISGTSVLFGNGMDYTLCTGENVENVECERRGGADIKSKEGRRLRFVNSEHTVWTFRCCFHFGAQ